MKIGEEGKNLCTSIVGGFFFLVCSMDVAPSSADGFEPVFQKGLSYRHYPYPYDSSFSNESLRRMAEADTEYVAITVWWLQKSITSTEIYARPGWTAENESLTVAIKRAHELDIKVMSKPMVDPEDVYTHWRGEIPPTPEWFESYKTFIVAYAQFAEENSVDIFCIGCEFEATEADGSRRRQIITEVRKYYSGPITHAATFESYQNIRWWNALDYVGLDAYFPLTNRKDPTLEELEQAWTRIADDIETWHDSEMNKLILFTEIGYRSGDGNNMQPWNWITQLESDSQEQFDCYLAAFEILWGKPWFYGFYWWIWESSPEAGGTNDTDFTPQKKSTECLIESWYSSDRHVDPSYYLKYRKASKDVQNRLIVHISYYHITPIATEVSSMSCIDELLEFLATTEGSHTLDEISRSVGISRHACEKIVHFLAKFGFLFMNDFKVQIKPKVRNFVIATLDKIFIELNPPITTF